MRVILVFVSTLDGKVTKWDKPPVRSWTSQEDLEYFTGLWKKSNLIVMGSNTYNSDPVKTSASQLLIVMTNNPERYRKQEIPGEIEFTKESPLELVMRFEAKGYEQMTVVGGPHVATSFLKEQLIDELWLTIEPKIFGTGGNFVTEEKFDFNLQLLSYEKVNKAGTLITRYKVEKKSDYHPERIKSAIEQSGTF